MDRQREKQRQGRAEAGRVPANRQGRRSGGGNRYLAGETSFGRLHRMRQLYRQPPRRTVRGVEFLRAIICERNDHRPVAIRNTGLAPLIDGILRDIAASLAAGLRDSVSSACVLDDLLDSGRAHA